MKTLIIYPKFPCSFKSFNDYMLFCTVYKLPPTLRPLKIVSLLPANWEKKIVDLNVSELKDAHIKWSDIVLISTTILQENSVRMTINRCKKMGKKVAIVGNLSQKACNKFKKADYFIIGNVEAALFRYIHDVDKGAVKYIYSSSEKFTPTPAPYRPIHNLDYIFPKSTHGLRLANWLKNNIHKEYFHRKGFKKDLKNFIFRTLSMLHKKYKYIDAISLFSGGSDSLLASLKVADANPDQKILLITFCHHFHEGNLEKFKTHFKTLKAIKKRTNIVGHEVINISDIFNSFSNPFNKRCLEEKLYPCIICKILMAYLADIILLNYRTKTSGQRSKYIITGNRGPAVMTFFQQTKKFERAVKKCIRVKYISPIYGLHNKSDVHRTLKTLNVTGFNNKSGIKHSDKQIICLVPFLGMDMGLHDRKMAGYFERGYKLLEDVIVEIEKCAHIKASILTN